MLDLVKVLGILREARGKIERPERWMTPERLAIGSCEPGSDCAMTALPSIMIGSSAEAAHETLAWAMGLMDHIDRIAVWNDSHTHAEVLAAFDKAIASIEAQINPLVYGFVLPEPTPNADAALAVLEACEEAGGVVARQIVTGRPDLDFEEVSNVAASELFYAAQDTAKTCFLGVKVERA